MIDLYEKYNLYIMNVFGSIGGEDTDVMYRMEKIPSIQECKVIADFLKVDGREPGGFVFHLMNDIDANFAVVEDGIITNVYKGTPDECNNSVFRTYHLQPQLFPCFVERLVKRNVELKIARALRSILSFLSQTTYRSEVKEALKGDTATKIRLLKRINISMIDDFGKNQSLEDIGKTFAFQIGQTRALMDGVELYSKPSISAEYPELESFLKRESTDFGYLDYWLQYLLKKITEKYSDLSIIKE